MSIVIDKDVALGALSGVIEKFGADHVYDSEGLAGCWYTALDQNGNLEPACIVGQALWGLGVDPEVIENLNEPGIITCDDNRTTLQSAGIVVSDAAYNVLREAQRVQDQGGTWGEALEAAQVGYQVV